MRSREAARLSSKKRVWRKRRGRETANVTGEGRTRGMVTERQQGMTGCTPQKGGGLLMKIRTSRREKKSKTVYKRTPQNVREIQMCAAMNGDPGQGEETKIVMTASRE